MSLFKMETELRIESFMRFEAKEECTCWYSEDIVAIADRVVEFIKRNARHSCSEQKKKMHENMRSEIQIKRLAHYMYWVLG